MTFVGKILVVVIMAFSLIFLGISAVVFTTENNWRQATQEAKKKYDDLKRKNDATIAENEVAKKDLEAAKSAHLAAQKALDDRINAMNADIKRAEEENSQSKTVLTQAQQSARSSLE